MAKIPNKLNASSAEKIMEALKTKNIRPLWFDKYGPKMDVLFSRNQILSEMGIDTSKLDALQMAGVNGILGTSIHFLKKFAQQRKFNWVEITVSDGGNRPHVYYGFTSNIDQIDANIIRFGEYRARFSKVAKTAKQLGDLQKRQIEET